MAVSREQLLKDYIHYLETLSGETVDVADQLVTNDIRFRDHVQDVTGIEEMKYILINRFEDVTDPVFKVQDFAFGQDNIAYIKWSFNFQGKKQEWRFRGVSEVHFSTEGRIKLHIDHWDAITQLYQKISGVSSMIQLLKKQVSL